MKETSLVLLSGGLDSLVNFKKAFDSTEVKLILTMDYGQISAVREIEAASLIAKKYSVEHRAIELDWFADLGFGLKGDNIPDYDPTKLDQLDYAKQTAHAVWVPNRNGILINIAASYADAMNINLIIVGFNKEEAATFSDNTSEYIIKTNEALRYSTQSKTRVHSYTLFLNKAEIVEYGRKIDAPFEFLWSCYHGGNEMCGECESCRRLKRALHENAMEEEFNRQNRWGFKK